MRKILDRLAVIYKKITNNNNFLKIVSLAIGIIAWFYVITIVNPLNTKEFSRVPVKIDLIGSIPERNGLALLINDTSISVNIEVEGPRTNLLNFSKEKLSAYLDLTPVTSAGSYGLEVKVKSTDPAINIVGIEPSVLYYEFDKSMTKSFDINLEINGKLPDGYTIADKKMSQNKVDITGPASVVNSIASVSVPVNVEGARDSIENIEKISFRNSIGENVDKTYLTISFEQISYLVDVAYRKTVPLSVKLVNNNGGDEKSYIKIDYDPRSVVIEGEESSLNEIDEILLGIIDLELLAGLEQTYPVLLPKNYKYVQNGILEATIKLTLDPKVAIKNYTFTSEEIANFKIRNAPENKQVKITTTSFTLPIRTLNYHFEGIDVKDIICLVDLSTEYRDGYLVEFLIPGDIPYGLMKKIYVNIELSDIENSNTQGIQDENNP